MSAADFLLVIPELLLTVGGLLLLMLAAFAGDRTAALVNALAALVLGVAMVAVVQLPDTPASLFFGTLRVDAFAAFAKILILGAAIIALLMAPRFFEREGFRGEYPVLVVFAALGMAIMVSAHDMMSLYIGLELNSLAAYVLASMSRGDARASEAGLKYFVLGALASGMLLFGISLLYGFTGSTSYEGIAHGISAERNLGLLFGLTFVVAGMAFKISAVPFHMWTPDVYEGAPTPVTAFFASAPKVAALALLTRLCMESFAGSTAAWQQIVIFMAIASMVLGAVGAIGQLNIKRLLAYSSIANVGFILIGLAAATTTGVAAMLVYLTVYVVMTLGSFLAVLQLRTPDGEMVEDVAALSGLWKQRPWLAAAIAIFMFSLAGIPPLFGFWPKLMVFQAAVDAGLLPLAVIGAIASVIGAFYYLRVIKVMLFDAPSNVALPAQGGRLELAVMSGAAAYVSVVGFVLAGPLMAWSARAAESLL